MSKKGISVVVPIYNGQMYLESFLKSLFNQTYRPLEVIIGDDASRDLSVDICKEWKEQNNSDEFCIRIIENIQNRGLTANVANIVKNVSYDYIAFADQDDVWDYNKLKVQINYMEEHPKCNVCLCDRCITDENLKVKINSEQIEKNYKKKSMRFEEVICHTGCYPANTMLIRSNVNGVRDIPSNVVCYDTYLAIMASVTGSVDYISDRLVLYRIHGNNLSDNFKAETSRTFFQLLFRRYLSRIRGRDKYNIDGKIIREEIINRYGIDIANLNNKIMNNRRIKCLLLRTIEQCIKDYKEGRIGIWLKEQ